MAAIVLSTTDRQAAYLVCEMLVWHGIPAHVRGDHRSGLGGALPTASLQLDVVIANGADQEQARTLIDALEQPGDSATWTCSGCGQANPPAFELCWGCQRQRGPEQQLGGEPSPYRGVRSSTDEDDSPRDGNSQPRAAPAPALTALEKATLRREVASTALAGILPATIIAWWHGRSLPPVGWSGATFAAAVNFAMAAVLALAFLLLVRRSPATVATSGLLRPRYVFDVVAAFMLAVLLMLVELVVIQLVGLEAADAKAPPRAPYFRPGDWLVLVPAAAAVCLTVQLVVAGVLLTRIDRLLRSRVVAVLVVGAIGVLLGGSSDPVDILFYGAQGVILGATFLKVRRIWPVAAASLLAYLFSWLIH